MGKASNQAGGDALWDRATIVIFKREFMAFFRQPVAYVFLVIFLLASVGSTFFLGRLLDTNQASLDPFFNFLPWLYLVFVPAVGMRLWAEERRSGTIELLFTLPVSLGQAVLGKFLAAWAFLGVGLILTTPLWATVAFLGEPDHGVILAGYLGSFLMAGSYLAITCLTSAMTKNQVVSFILGVVVCFVLVLVGWGVFTDLLATVFPAAVIDWVAGLGFMTHFASISRGLVDTRDLIYFASVIVGSLMVTTGWLSLQKSN